MYWFWTNLSLPKGWKNYMNLWVFRWTRRINKETTMKSLQMFGSLNDRPTDTMLSIQRISATHVFDFGYKMNENACFVLRSHLRPYKCVWIFSNKFFCSSFASCCLPPKLKRQHNSFWFAYLGCRLVNSMLPAIQCAQTNISFFISSSVIRIVKHKLNKS